MCRFSARALLLLLVLSLLSVAAVRADAQADEDALAAEMAAEDAAAAAIEEAAEEEDEDAADAHDDDADSARYDPEHRHPLSDLPPPSDDVRIGHSFVSGLAADDKTAQPAVTLGKPIKTVVALANRARTPCHVWGVVGSLNHDNDFAVHVQNFSYALINKTVASEDDLSFSYEFAPNARLDIRPFRLAITVLYETQSLAGKSIRGHSTTFYNATVITEPGSETMSNSMFMIFFFFAVAAAGAAWYVWTNMETSAPKPDAVEMGTTDSSNNQWLEEHHTMARTGGGRAKLRTNSGKKE